MTAPAILRISEEIRNDQEAALLLSSTTHDVSNGTDLGFPKLRPINVPPETPDTSAQHASHRSEDLHQASRRTDGPSQDAPPKGVCLSDNGETTEDGASDEELIELGENDSINGTSRAPMDMSSDELPAAAATLRDAHPVNDATDDSDDTSGNDSSEEYSSDDVTRTHAVGRIACQKSTSAPEPTKDIAATSEQASRRLRETDKIANVNVQDHWDYSGQTPSIDIDPTFGTRVEPCAISNDAAISNSEDDIGLSDKTTISVQVSRDRVASFGSHYACSHCDRTFTTPDALLSHIRSANENSPWYTCSTCNRGFVASEPFKAHLTEFPTHMRVGGRQQPVLPSRTKTEREERLSPMTRANSHSNSTRRRKSYCSTCDQTYKSIDHLVKHRRRYHKSAPYKCMSCSTDFPAGVNLKYHLLEFSDHMQVVLEAVIPILSASTSNQSNNPRSKAKKGTASAVIELSSDSEASDTEVELNLKARQTITLGGKAQIRACKVRSLYHIAIYGLRASSPATSAGRYGL